MQTWRSLYDVIFEKWHWRDELFKPKSARSDSGGDAKTA